MKISIHAIGRMKNGPERELFQRYWERCIPLGKAQSVPSFTLREYAESKASRPADRMMQEADELLKQIDEKAFVIALDERGKTLTSPDFADFVQRYRDDGTGEMAFVIGGADGFHEKVRKRANRLISFGAMTWPHQIVRILAAEQIYRSLTILSGHPYHKL